MRQKHPPNAQVLNSSSYKALTMLLDTFLVELFKSSDTLSPSTCTSDTQALNSSFAQAFAPVQANMTAVITSNLSIFEQFNTSLAYNPFSQVWL